MGATTLDIRILQLAHALNTYQGIMTQSRSCSHQSEDLVEELWQIRSAYGTIIHPLASYMLLRSLRTYDLRVARMLETTQILLQHIIKSEFVDRVFIQDH